MNYQYPNSEVNFQFIQSTLQKDYVALTKLQKTSEQFTEQS